jgi:hypothetical protein
MTRFGPTAIRPGIREVHWYGDRQKDKCVIRPIERLDSGPVHLLAGAWGDVFFRGLKVLGLRPLKVDKKGALPRAEDT